MLRRIPKGLIVLLSIFTAGFYHFYSLDGLDGFVWSCLFKPHDTHYSKGYTDEGFRSLVLGDSKEKVTKILGEPLSEKSGLSSMSEGRTFLRFSESPTSTHYYVRIIVLDKNDKLVKKISEYYID